MSGILNKTSMVENSEKRRIAYFIRHDETAMNEEDVARGWTDVPLEKDTLDHLIELGGTLTDINGIYSSDLLRTLQTAHCISLGSGKPILGTSAWLHTWDIGKYTGQKTDKVDPILEEMALERPFETIEGGESFEEFKHRFLLSLIGCLNSNPGKLLAFVTHGRNLACLNAWKEDGYNDALQLDPDHLGYDEFEPGSAHLFDIKSGLLL